MGSWIQRSTIVMAARVDERVQETWTEGKLAGILLIDVKGAFDDVSRNLLLRIIEGIGADRELTRETEKFMSDISVDFVIQRHQYEEAAVDTSIL